MKRLSSIAAAVALLLATAAAPASAQTGGGNGNGNNGNNGNNGANSANESCTQSTSGAGGTASGTQANRSNSRQTLIGVIDALVNVQGVDPNVAANALNSSNVQVVCLNDALNQNDLSILNDVLSGDNVLNNSLNNDLNNLARGAQVLNGVQLLSNVHVLTVDVGSPQPTIFLIG